MNVYDDIREERQLQNARGYTVTHDDGHRLHDWVALIASWVGKLAWCPTRGGRRRVLLGIAAVAVAALESHDRREKGILL